MLINKFIVTYVENDRNGNCDGKSRIEMVVDTEEEAKECIKNSICNYIVDHTSDSGDCEFIPDFDHMRVHTPNFDCCCEWNYHHLDINFTKCEIKNYMSEKVSNLSSKAKDIGKEIKKCYNNIKGIWKQ